MYKTLTLSLCLLPTASWAITNIEDQRPGPPEQGWSGTLEVGMDGKTGDNQEKNYKAGTKVTYRHNNNVLLGIATREYGSTRDIKDTDEAFVHARWVHSFSHRWASEAFAQWEENVFSNLSSRVLFGGGARYLVASKEDIFSLAVGFGAFHESEKLDLQTYEEETDTWRVNTYYAYKHQLTETTYLASTGYIQPSVEDMEDLRSFITLSLGVKVTESLDLKVAYEVNYDSMPAQNLNATPPIDNNKVNTEYSTSLVYRF